MTFDADQDDQSSSQSEPLPCGHSCKAKIKYFFALDSDGRTAWPFRNLIDMNGHSVLERWRFGFWVHSKELDRILNGHDDQWVPATSDQVDAWISRQVQFSSDRILSKLMTAKSKHMD